MDIIDEILKITILVKRLCLVPCSEFKKCRRPCGLIFLQILEKLVERGLSFVRIGNEAWTKGIWPQLIFHSKPRAEGGRDYRQLVACLFLVWRDGEVVSIFNCYVEILRHFRQWPMERIEVDIVAQQGSDIVRIGGVGAIQHD